MQKKKTRKKKTTDVCPDISKKRNVNNCIVCVCVCVYVPPVASHEEVLYNHNYSGKDTD